MSESVVSLLSLAYRLLTGSHQSMPKRSPHRLTKRFVDAARARAAGLIRDEVFFDRDLPGFGVRVRPSGTTTYLVQFRDAEGRSQRMSLGRHGPLTCEQARIDALKALGLAAHGDNPALARKAARQAMTVAELGERYFAAAAAGAVRGKLGLPKKANTLRIDRYRWQTYVVPLLGRRAARELTRKDLENFLCAAAVRAQSAGRTGAGERRLKGMLGGVFNWAVRAGDLETNPCSGVQTRPDGRRRVALDEAHYRALGVALASATSVGEAWQAVEALRLIALTGARRGEITGLRWSEVDLAGQALRLADSKTGASVRPLGKRACDVLRRVHGLSGTSSFVFPAARDAERPYAGLGRASRRIIGRAVVTQDGETLTPHGLRHAFAGVAAGELNYAEPTIAALIGHTGTSITSRYIFHLDAILIAAADAVSGWIAGWLDEGMALAALEARKARPSAICVISDPKPETDVVFDFHPDAKVRAFVDSDVVTQEFPADAQMRLAASLRLALARLEAGLPVLEPRRGAKPQAWALDVFIRDVEQAFDDLGAGELVAARTGSSNHMALHPFAARLLAAVGVKTSRQSLTDNARRARSIERHALPPTAYKTAR